MPKAVSREQYLEFVKILTCGNHEDQTLRRQAWNLYIENVGFPGKTRLKESVEDLEMFVLQSLLDQVYTDPTIALNYSFGSRYDLQSGAVLKRNGISAEVIEQSKPFRLAMLEDLKPRATIYTIDDIHVSATGSIPE
jgi:hypothetical protein